MVKKLRLAQNVRNILNRWETINCSRRIILRGDTEASQQAYIILTKGQQDVRFL